MNDAVVSEEAAELSDLKVMVIDDSKTIRRTAENLLKKEGLKHCRKSLKRSRILSLWTL